MAEIFTGWNKRINALLLSAPTIEIHQEFEKASFALNVKKFQKIRATISLLENVSQFPRLVSTSEIDGQLSPREKHEF